jgi:hypothetical protein
MIQVFVQSESGSTPPIKSAEKPTTPLKCAMRRDRGTERGS